MDPSLTRRRLLQGAGAGLLAGAAPKAAARAAGRPWSPPPGAVAISSRNGLRTVAEAWRRVTEAGERPVHAAVQGVAIVEADPKDHSVGYGGLPNEEGVVQLDAACMDGPTHNAGAVGALEDIKHPAQVAELVMERTDHVLLVGEGARRFALAHGFPAEDLLTPESRAVWLRWRARRSRDDDWLAPLEEQGLDHDGERIWGTIHCSVLGPNGDLGCCTTTSGLSFKIPGRVGDSPLIGCGLYCDNEVGSAGATGRGEAAILAGGSWLVVERMRAGDTPEEACLAALQRVSDYARRQARWQPGLWDEERRRPAFSLRFYAVRKDGLYGSASMYGRPGARSFAVCDARGARLEAGALLYPAGG